MKEMIYYILFVIFLIIVGIILFATWYYLVHNVIDMASLAHNNGFVPYPHDRNTCQELVLNYKTDKNLPKIAVVSVSIGNRKFAQHTREFLTKYCNTHGYNLHYFSEIVDSKYNVMWQKVAAFNKVLTSDKYDYVAWFDDDIIVKNMDIKLESFISLTDKPMVISRDVYKKYYNMYLNAGCFIMKNCEITKELLTEWLDGYHNLFNGKYQTTLHHDQTILTYLFFKKYHHHIEVIPHGVMQTIHGFIESQEGEFALHMAGLKPKVRERLTQEYRNKINS